MGRRAKKSDSGLGRAIVKNYVQQKSAPRAGPDDVFSLLHTTEASDTTKLQSHLETNDLEAFMSNAILADQDFTATKENVVVMQDGMSLAIDPVKRKEAEEKHKNAIKVPRRPAWDKDTTAEQLKQQEKESFLRWRRDLSEAEENDHLVITPFEKNLEVWRQLWRVTERSHIVAQIVDCRNPLLFRCADLEKFVQEVKIAPLPKKNLLIMNKADYLTKPKRTAWAQYFKKNNIEFIFFSAFAELQKIEAEAAAEKDASIDNVEGSKPARAKKKFNSTHIYTREELLDKLKELGEHVEADKQVVVGMVGYPNVGKSSTINCLFKEKRVAVSSTPGKTKHFQTIHLDSRLMLCDCPGLVFPNFATTKADLICNGVLPIDQMRSHYESMDLVCERIPRATLEEIYGVVLPKPREQEDPNRPPRGTELAQAYAYVRGYMTAVSGRPDESRAARIILKDYVNGKLLYTEDPPAPKNRKGKGSSSKQDGEEAAAVEPTEDMEELEEDDEAENVTAADAALAKKMEKKANRQPRENRPATAQRYVDDELGSMAAYTDVKAIATPAPRPGSAPAGGPGNKKHNRNMKRKAKKGIVQGDGFNVQLNSVGAVKQTASSLQSFSRPTGGGFEKQ